MNPIAFSVFDFVMRNWHTTKEEDAAQKNKQPVTTKKPQSSPAHLGKK